MLSNSFRNLFGLGQKRDKNKQRGKRNKDGVVVDVDGSDFSNNPQFKNKLGDRTPQISYKGVHLRGRVLKPKAKTMVKLSLCNGPVVIEGKCKNIILDGCYDITVKFDEAIEGITLTKCDNAALTGFSRKVKIDNSTTCNLTMPKSPETDEATKDKPINLNYFKSTGAAQIGEGPLEEVKEKEDITLSYQDGEWKVVRKEAHPRLGSSRLKSWRDSWAAFLGGGTLRGSLKGNGV